MGAALRLPIHAAPDWPAAVGGYLPQPGGEGGTRGRCSPEEHPLPVALHAADAAGLIPYHGVAWAGGRHALVVGAEAEGLSEWVRREAGRDGGAVQLLAVPLALGPHRLGGEDPAAGAEGTAAAVESLNAAVAGSIILCEAHRQMSAK